MKRGFTIIELLVTVCIIGLLTSVVLVATNSARKKSRDDTRKANIQSVALSLEMYYAKEKKYPTSDGFDNSWSALKTALANFAPAWPTDPSHPTGNYGSGFVYLSPDGKKYILDATLELNGNQDPAPADCTDVTTTNNSASSCYFSDSYKVGDTTHFRVSSQ